MANNSDGTANVLYVGNSGQNNIDSLLSNFRWSSKNITYSFPNWESHFLYQYSNDNEPWDGFQPLSEAQKAGARAALQAWANVANITFTEVSEPNSVGTIRIAQSDSPSTAQAYRPGTDQSSGDVWFGSYEDYSNPQWKTYANFSFSAGFLHELGHAIGLKHPQNYNYGDKGIEANSTIDAFQYTVMSYCAYVGANYNYYHGDVNSFPQTPMMNDIQAVQYMYGANYNYNSGNTIYKFNPTDYKIFQTIWDGGGVDTYDLSSYTTDTVIQLNPGSWSKFSDNQLADLGDGQKPPGNVANALLYNNNPCSLIENAVGGYGNDIIRGNLANNVLDGGAGQDQLWGGTGGDDILLGGAGSDTYWWGKGNGHDQVTNSPDNAQDALWLYNIYSGQYAAQNINGDFHFALADGSTLDLKGWYYSAPNNRVQSFVFADKIAYAWNNGSGATVNLSNKIYLDNGINHLISLDSGNSTLRGGLLSDVIEGGNNSDQIWGGVGGSDTLIGRAGADAYWWGKGDGHDQITTSPDNAQDALWLYNVYKGQYTTQNINGDLQLSVADGSTLDLKGWYTSASNNRIQSFVLADKIAYAWNNGSGATVNLSNKIYLDNGINHLISLDAGNSTLRGGLLSDVIEGGNSSDQIWGGSGGNDTLVGGSGADTYWWSAGDSYDTIAASSSNNQDLVYIYGNLTKNNLDTVVSGNDLILRYGSNQLTIQDWNMGTDYQLNQFYFASDKHTYQLSVTNGASQWALMK